MRVLIAAMAGAMLVCGVARAEILRPQSTCGDALRIIKSRDASSIGSLVQFMSDTLENSDAEFVKKNKLSVLKSITDKMQKKLVDDAIGACRGNENLPASLAAMASYMTLRIALDLPGDGN